MSGKAMNGVVDVAEHLGIGPGGGIPYKPDASDLARQLRQAADRIDGTDPETNGESLTPTPEMVARQQQLVGEINKAEQIKHIVDTTEVQETRGKNYGLFDGTAPPAGWVMDPNTLTYGPPASAKELGSLALRVAALERMFSGPVHRETLDEARKRSKILFPDTTPAPALHERTPSPE